MRKICLVKFLLLCFLFTGCGKIVGQRESNQAMQELYDRSQIAKEYSEKCFQAYMVKRGEECNIEETSYGFFISQNQPVYLVSIKYNDGNATEIYTYKISIDEDYNCSILEQYPGVGKMP